MTTPRKVNEQSGRYAFEGLDRVLHEKARLGILSSLVSNPEGLVFNELKDLCQLTDGNLARHMQVLEESGLIEVSKGMKGKRPQTLVRLTDEGRARFLEYVNLLENIVAETLDAARAAKRAPAARRAKLGWSPG